MRVPWQRQEYARTCDTWQVPRSAPRRHIRSISGFMVAPGGRGADRGELARELQSIAAEKQAVEAFQCCPECGADQFTQHAARDGPSGG